MSSLSHEKKFLSKAKKSNIASNSMLLENKQNPAESSLSLEMLAFVTRLNKRLSTHLIDSPYPPTKNFMLSWVIIKNFHDAMSRVK